MVALIELNANSNGSSSEISCATKYLTFLSKLIERIIHDLKTL